MQACTPPDCYHSGVNVIDPEANLLSNNKTSYSGINRKDLLGVLLLLLSTVFLTYVLTVRAVKANQASHAGYDEGLLKTAGKKTSKASSDECQPLPFFYTGSEGEVFHTTLSAVTPVTGTASIDAVDVPMYADAARTIPLGFLASTSNILVRGGLNMVYSSENYFFTEGPLKGGAITAFTSFFSTDGSSRFPAGQVQTFAGLPGASQGVFAGVETSISVIVNGRDRSGVISFPDGCPKIFKK
eukprot:gb/GEZN01012570.1/.p1 GENE.gb/GEZN01012570.1/~~gb/GEZN01012570.1/.p1  ORF type:complete len:250 (+),score=27.98 gb/GEZN01012570.1/:25-750(+)